MKTIRILILEDDLRTLAVIMDELFNSVLHPTSLPPSLKLRPPSLHLEGVDGEVFDC